VLLVLPVEMGPLVLLVVMVLPVQPVVMVQ